MIRTLIDREVSRLERNGYDAVVVTDEFRMDGTKKVINLGCDTAILTGIYYDDDLMTNNEEITIASPTDCVSASMERIAASGVNIHKVMRQYMSISKETDSAQPVYVNFVRICPKQKTPQTPLQ